MGLWRPNHTTRCCENKNKNTPESPAAFIYQCKIANNPGFSTAKQMKDAIVLTLLYLPPPHTPFCSAVCSVFLTGGTFVITTGKVRLAGTALRLPQRAQSQTHRWCNSTKAPSRTEGTNLALCILNKLLTLLGMKKWLLKSLPPHTNANDSRRTREC